MRVSSAAATCRVCLSQYKFAERFIKGGATGDEAYLYWTERVGVGATGRYRAQSTRPAVVAARSTV